MCNSHSSYKQKKTFPKNSFSSFFRFLICGYKFYRTDLLFGEKVIHFGYYFHLALGRNENSSLCACQQRKQDSVGLLFLFICFRRFLTHSLLFAVSFAVCAERRLKQANKKGLHFVKIVFQLSLKLIGSALLCLSSMVCLCCAKYLVFIGYERIIK